MNKYVLKFSRRANAQLRGIYSYIAERNADAVLKMVDALESKANLLKETPFIGVELTKKEYPFLVSGYRKLIINPFSIYYRVEKQTVFITHIIHSKRDQAKALTDKEH